MSLSWFVDIGSITNWQVTDVDVNPAPAPQVFKPEESIDKVPVENREGLFHFGKVKLTIPPIGI